MYIQNALYCIGIAINYVFSIISLFNKKEIKIKIKLKYDSIR